jgi:type II secretory pathway pseudopilin PulG
MSERISRDRGESLIELLVALTLLGLAVVAIVSALGASILMSDIHRKQATAGAEVRSFAEKIESVVATGSGGYVACAGTGTYAGAYTVPAGYTKAVTLVRYWTGSAWSATCGSDIGLQKLTLQISSSDGRAAETLDVVIRKPCDDPLLLCT